MQGRRHFDGLVDVQLMEKPQYGHQVFFDEVSVIDERKTDKCEIKYVKTHSFGNVLFMDGEVQLSTMDEYRYHEQLVHPLMEQISSVKDAKVLVIGGGDGCAAREILKWSNVSSVTIVDYDEEFVKEYGMGILKDVNGDAFRSEKVHYVCNDAVEFLHEDQSLYNAIFVDLPDPDAPEMVKLYIDTIELIHARMPWFYATGFSIHVGPAIINPESPQRQIIKEFQTLLRNTVGAHNCWMETCYVPSFSNEWAFLYGARKFHDVADGSLIDQVRETCKFWNGTRRPLDRDLMLA